MGRLPSAVGDTDVPSGVSGRGGGSALARAEDGQTMLRHRLESRQLESRVWIHSYPTWPVTSLRHSGSMAME